MSKTMNELVAGVGVNKEKKSKASEYKSASEWPKCCKPGCPLWATIKDGVPTCTYHHRTNGRDADVITEAVKEHIPYINKYKEMLRWDVRMWRDREDQIMGWPVLPATKLEMDMPSLYLARFYKWIETSIKEKATEIYKGH